MRENFNDNFIEGICRLFGIEGEYRSFELVTNGHINTTFKVYFFRNGEIKDYILQRINSYVFKNPVQVMQNISTVTEYIRREIKSTGISAKRLVLHYQKTANDKYYLIGPSGGFWRCSRFVDGSATYNTTEDPKVIEETGKAFGSFQLQLAHFPVKSLYITIPHFHNTVNRYELFDQAVQADQANRAASVASDIREYKAFEEIATKMYRMQRSKELPLKVTHNDTKCNNVLFDEETRESLCVIDLDTIMPGLVGFDFGDAIRFIANKAKEDESDLTKVGIDLSKYDSFAKGFIGVVKDTLCPAEKDTLALGSITMTLECGLRFLTDYIDGDKYFHVDYPTHNLVRARCQLELAKDMIRHYDEMTAIVKKYCSK